MIKKGIIVFCSIFSIFIIISVMAGAKKNDYIKYVEFNVTYDVLKKALDVDIASQSEDVKINWIDILAYLGAKYGGNFSSYKSKDLDSIVNRLKSGEKIEDITKDMKYFSYYREAYGAVLDGFVGNYSVEEKDEKGNIVKTEKYGLKVYSPIAKTFPFSHYDDFGATRTYGYKRQHLGHDMMAAVGTPVISVEEGIVEVMGWNQYGGWRVGIRSLDGKRYYYYAHLRKDRPFNDLIKEGEKVNAGDVIGYVGRTGYSTKENVNNIEDNHLHFGIQLIFDESQKECDNEIWIDVYAITLLLQQNQSEVYRDNNTKEWYSVNQKSQGDN